MENGTYEQIVSHLETELELNGLEFPDELPINTVTQQAPQQNSEKPKQRATIAKNQVNIKIIAVNSNEIKTTPEITRIVPTITMVVPNKTLTPTIKFSNNTKANNTNNQRDRKCRPAFPPCGTCVELTTPQRNVPLEQTQQTDRLPGIDDRKDKTKSNREMLEATQMRMSKLQPKLYTKNATSSLRSRM